MPPRKKKSSTSSQGLLNALNFISAAQENEADSVFKTHCQIANKTISAYDGILTIGCKIEEGIEAYPHTLKLIAALERCNKDLSITELEGKLSVRSGPFSALIPCYHDPMPTLTPDPASWPIDDRLRMGFETIAHLTVENAKKVVQSSLLLRANSMISTDSVVMLEFWHGIDLPTMTLPKTFVSAVLATNKKLISFGYSGNSCTFWFEDESWIKTQLYEESWPDTDKILNIACKPEPIPVKFYEALKTVSAFSEGKIKEQKVYFGNGILQSHRDKEQGASYEVEGIKPGPCFGVERLKRIEHCIETVDFYSHSAMYLFAPSKGVRGALMGIRG